MEEIEINLKLEEYVSGIDPLDAFRFYRESAGPF